MTGTAASEGVEVERYRASKETRGYGRLMQRLCPAWGEKEKSPFEPVSPHCLKGLFVIYSYKTDEAVVGCGLLGEIAWNVVFASRVNFNK